MTKTTEPKKVEAFIISTFTDAGTEQRFVANKIEPIEEGAFGNYAAAGLVRTPTEKDRANSAPAKAVKTA